MQAEAEATKTAISELSSRIASAETNFDGIRSELKSVYTDMNSIDARHDEIQLRVGSLHGHNSRHDRSESGMMAFAQRIETRIGDLMQQQLDLRDHAAQLSQGVEGMIDREVVSSERSARTGCVLS